MVGIDGDFDGDDCVIFVCCLGVECFSEFYDVCVVLIECGIDRGGWGGFVCWEL